MEVECDVCETVFEQRPAKVERNDHNFCSRECYHKWKRDEWTHPFRGEMVTLECEWCGKEYEVHPYREENSRFCSSECMNEYNSQLSGEDAPAWKGGKLTLRCEWCGDEFEAWPSRVPRKRFCSQGCYDEWQSEVYSGEGNPVWRGGYEPYYGPNWEEQREKALERDGYECQRCGKEDSEEDPLHVHHKTPMREFDDFEKANDIENLITYCNSCHLQIEWQNEGAISS